MNEQQEIKGVEEQLHLKYRKLREGAHSPTRATLESIGYDLKSPQRCEIKPKTSAAIATGLAIEIPAGHYGRLAPKSKLAWEYSMIVLGGVIDPDYTEEISVIILQFGRKGFDHRKRTKLCSTNPGKSLHPTKTRGEQTENNY